MQALAAKYHASLGWDEWVPELTEKLRAQILRLTTRRFQARMANLAVLAMVLLIARWRQGKF